MCVFVTRRYCVKTALNIGLHKQLHTIAQELVSRSARLPSYGVIVVVELDFIDLLAGFFSRLIVDILVLFVIDVSTNTMRRHASRKIDQIHVCVSCCSSLMGYLA